MKLFSGLTERLRDGLKRSQEYLSQSFSAVLEPGRPITAIGTIRTICRQFFQR